MENGNSMVKMESWSTSKLIIKTVIKRTVLISKKGLNKIESFQKVVSYN